MTATPTPSPNRNPFALAEALRAELHPTSALGRFLANHLIDAATHLQSLLTRRTTLLDSGNAPDKDLARSIISAERSFASAYTQYQRHERLEHRDSKPAAPKPSRPPLDVVLTPPATPEPSAETEPTTHDDQNTTIPAAPAATTTHYNRRQRRALLAAQRHSPRRATNASPPAAAQA